MGIFLVILLVVDVVLLLASYAQSQQWAYSLCSTLSACSNPRLLVAFAVVLVGVLLVMRIAR